MNFNWPLMKNNITRDDIDKLVKFLKEMPRLTQSENVKAFEQEWSEWLGIKYSVFVNSGSSANFISMAVIKHLYGSGEIIVPPLTWVSDIVSVIHNGFKPVFVDINPYNLGMNDEQVIAKLTDKTRAVFITHVQGFNALTDRLLDTLKERNIPLVEDVCESHGATFKEKKLGSFGLISDFSFYFAHHMSTVEGGMVCCALMVWSEKQKIMSSKNNISKSIQILTLILFLLTPLIICEILKLVLYWEETS